MRGARPLCVAAVAVVAMMTTPGTAAAADPPDIDSIRVIAPEDPPPAPASPMEQRTACAVSAMLADSAIARPAPANVAFDVATLHEFATGKGITVAVIDSGVAPNDRLPRLIGGGDYIGAANGLEDCDHHGTLVAGIIGAQPSSTDGFVGVAPDSTLIAIRQTSSAYEPVDRDAANAAGSSTLSTLARAVVHAANMNAQVINLSVTACFPDSSVVDTAELGEALRYAVDVKDAVVVTSAGNTNDATCKANPGYDPSNAADARNWANTHTVSMPSYYSPLVLSVGGADLTGAVYPGTMAGPWVGVAAPAVDIVSLDPTKPSGGLTNASVGQNGPQTIAGTSFASAYIAGLAALLRERYPELNAKEIRERIVDTAHTPANTQIGAFGAGLADPVAALTSGARPMPRTDAVQSRSWSSTKDVPHWQWVPAAVAVGGVALVTVLVLLAVGGHRLRKAADRARSDIGEDRL
nr:type VII secretion-associated serine protease mycosin [Rhodococcus sp. (in: high G+C Gram-positive bacteria)]